MIFFFLKSYPLLRYGCEHTIFDNIIPRLKFKFSYLATMEISPSHLISLSFNFPTCKKKDDNINLTEVSAYLAP